MDRIDVAIDHFEAAVIADLALGHRPCHAISRAALADALDQRGGPGDAARAAELRAGAVADARHLGMDARAQQWSAGRETERITFQRAGRTWRIRSGQRSTVVPHTVGMGYLTRLVEHRDVEITSLELASGLAVAPCGPTPVLDDAAKAAYRRRIEELRAEVDDAESCADLVRAERARDELDRVVDEIGRATGLAGRTRAFTDEAERAACPCTRPSSGRSRPSPRRSPNWAGSWKPAWSPAPDASTAARPRSSGSARSRAARVTSRARRRRFAAALAHLAARQLRSPVFHSLERRRHVSA